MTAQLGGDVATVDSRGGAHQRWWRGLAHRWPTALAVALAALNLAGGGSDDDVAGFGEIMLLLPLVYLVVAALRRPTAAWPVLVGLLASVVVLQALDVVAPPAALTGLALLVLLWRAGRGDLQRPGVFRIEAVGMVLFGLLAIVGLAVDPDVGRYLVAGGWFFHGVWDFAHLRANQVIVRSYAEWCGVFDVLIGLQLAFTL